MSGERVNADNIRSRSLLRQVRDKFGGTRRHADRRAESTSSALINTTRTSADQYESRNIHVKSNSETPPPPTSFSHHLSILVNVKSRFSKARKCSTPVLTPNIDNRKALSLPPIISNTVSYLKLRVPK